MKLSKDTIYLIVIVMLIALCGQFYYSYHYTPTHQTSVYYNQDIQANQEVLKLIHDADKFIYFAIYTFTRSDIADALAGAKYRGLDIRGVVDREQTADIEQQGKIVKMLQDKGIPIVFQDHTGLMHIKTLVTDKGYVSGSYNWTSNATNLNDEVLEVGHDNDTREQYQKIIEKLFNKYQISSAY